MRIFTALRTADRSSVSLSVSIALRLTVCVSRAAMWLSVLVSVARYRPVPLFLVRCALFCSFPCITLSALFSVPPHHHDVPLCLLFRTALCTVIAYRHMPPRVPFCTLCTLYHSWRITRCPSSTLKCLDRPVATDQKKVPMLYDSV